MASVYEVDIRVGLEDQVSGPINAMAAALNRANQLIANNQEKMIRMREEGQKLSMAFTQLFIGHEMMKWGEKGLGIIGGMIKAAGDLETAMLQVKFATGLSNIELGKMGEFVQKLAGTHTMSVTDAAKMVGIVAKTTFKSPAEMQNIMGGTGGIADFADTMQGTMGVEEATKLGMQFAGMLGTTSPEEVRKQLDQFNRFIRSGGGAGPQQMMNSLKNILPQGRSMGVDPKGIMQLTALVESEGLKSRETTQLRNFLTTVMLGRAGALKGKQAGALTELGLMSGPMDLRSLIGAVAAHPQGEQLVELATGLNRKEGTAAIQALTDPKTLRVWDKLVSQWEVMPSLEEDHNESLKSINQQLKIFQTNLETLQTNLGGTILQYVNPMVKRMGEIAANMGDVVKAHPMLSAVGVTAGAGLAAATTAGGAVLIAGGMAKLMQLRFGVGNALITTGGIGSGPGGGGSPSGAMSKLGIGLAGVTGGLEGWTASASDTMAGKAIDAASGATIVAAATALGGPLGYAIASAAIPAVTVAAQAMGEYFGDPHTSTKKTEENIARIHAKALEENTKATNANTAATKSASGRHATNVMQALQITEGAPFMPSSITSSVPSGSR